MRHIALYRAWRPQSFRDVVGQEAIVRTLRNSIREERFSHAYLFCGPRGTGKTSAAKIMAKAVNCERFPAEEPCNTCESCKRITEGTVMDVLEIDAASNRGVDEIREIRDKVKYAPTEVRLKVYIIDEVHMLTTEAFNALLKTLEEPPAHVMFILATTEPNKLPPTIISRCQRYDFKRVDLTEQVNRLSYVCEQEGIHADAEALQYIARLSDGGMRDALSLLDQVVSFCGTSIGYEQVVAVTGGIPADEFARFADILADQDAAAALQAIDEMMQNGRSPDKCMDNLIYFFRDLMLLKLVPGAAEMTERILDAARFQETADRFETGRLFAIMDILNHYQHEMKYASGPQLLFEMAILKICSAADTATSAASTESEATTADGAAAGGWQALARKVELLERKLEALGSAGNVQSVRSSAGKQESVARPSKTAAAALGRPISAQLGKYTEEASVKAISQVLPQWSKVLQGVKTRKITVHAWLVDGEPVSVTEDAVLVAFKNAIHRDTTEKPANKQLIEQEMADIYGKPLRLDTILHKDWDEAMKSRPASSSAGSKQEPRAEELRLEPEEVSESVKHKEPWIREAIELFGEELVTIKDDK